MIKKLQKFYRNHKELLWCLVIVAVFAVLCVDDVWAAGETTTSNSSGKTSSVIGEVRQRAINVIEHIKAIAYVMGGFGLIGLAWGAIFGKINWKWFGSLAIGLFIISWMGMTIDYFTRRGNSGVAATAFRRTGPSDMGCKGDCFGDKAAGLLGGAAVSGAANSNAGSDNEMTEEERKEKEKAEREAQEKQKWCDDNKSTCSECGEETSGTCQKCVENGCDLYEEEEIITFSCEELYQNWSDAIIAGKENEASTWASAYTKQGCPPPTAEQKAQMWCRRHFVQCASCGSVTVTGVCEECKKNNCDNNGGDSSGANSCDGCDAVACTPVSSKYMTCSRNNCCGSTGQ